MTPSISSVALGKLFTAARAGDPSAQCRAFNIVFARLARWLHARLPINSHTAEDLAQEALLVALNPRVLAERLERYPWGYLYRVGENIFHGRKREILCTRPVHENDPARAATDEPDRAVRNAIFSLAYREALVRLNDDERTASGLHYKKITRLEGERTIEDRVKRTGREIAEIMGKSESSVAKYIHSARLKIAKHFFVHHRELYDEHREYFRKHFEDHDD